MLDIHLPFSRNTSRFIWSPILRILYLVYFSFQPHWGAANSSPHQIKLMQGNSQLATRYLVYFICPSVSSASSTTTRSLFMRMYVYVCVCLLCSTLTTRLICQTATSVLLLCWVHKFAASSVRKICKSENTACCDCCLLLIDAMIWRSGEECPSLYRTEYYEFISRTYTYTIIPVVPFCCTSRIEA